MKTQQARVAVTLHGFKRIHGDDARLREIFERYDTSGDGFLDPSEVKLAMRCATGFELELEDCERLVRSLVRAGELPISLAEEVAASVESRILRADLRSVTPAFIRELVEDGILRVSFVGTADNWADFFTKPLQGQHFFRMRAVIMNEASPATGGRRV